MHKTLQVHGVVMAQARRAQHGLQTWLPPAVLSRVFSFLLDRGLVCLLDLEAAFRELGRDCLKARWRDASALSESSHESWSESYHESSFNEFMQTLHSQWFLLMYEWFTLRVEPPRITKPRESQLCTLL